MELCNPRPYSFAQKAKAFARGLPRSPLVGVALEGIMGSHSLSAFQEFRYATRLAEHGTSRFLCRALRNGASRTIQDIFSTAIRKRFEERLRFMSVVSYALWGAGHPLPTFQRACLQDARDAAELRKLASKALASGNVSSEPAQADLVTLLREYNILERHFASHVPELGGHDNFVLASADAPDGLKKLLMRELADSRSIARRGLLGLPLTPYD